MGFGDTILSCNAKSSRPSKYKISTLSTIKPSGIFIEMKLAAAFSLFSPQF